MAASASAVSNGMVLQRRSAQKITFPSVWTNACCSHPLWNQSEIRVDSDDIGVRIAAQRKLKHELNIEEMELDRMKVMGRFLYKAMYNDQWGEHEIDHVIIIPDFDPSEMVPNSEEVEEVAVVTSEQLKEMLNGAAAFSPWFRLFAQQKFLYNWWRNLHKLDALRDFETIHRLN